MDIRKIKKLIDLLEDSNLSEIEIQEGEESIRLSRASQVAAPIAAPVAQAAPAASVPVAQEEKPATDVPDGDAVNSPMVGTYYSAPKPGAADFVKLGDKVAVGDVLCIIEAMKIFNQIEAEKAGTIVAINKEGGDPVEYGEPLFIIK